MLSDKQAIDALSLIKLGAYYGVIDAKNVARIDKLIIAVSPFNLVGAAVRPLNTEKARAIYRAETVRNTIKNIAKLNL